VTIVSGIGTPWKAAVSHIGPVDVRLPLFDMHWIRCFRGVSNRENVDGMSAALVVTVEQLH
jgi:hypothetical protein